MLKNMELPPCLSGKDAFLLYDTYGFPVEITTEVAQERGVTIDRKVVESLLVKGKPVIHVSEGSDLEVLLDRTPFYAESGGQIGDHGFLYGTVRDGVLEVGKEVEATIDVKLRQWAKVHHTATHLLQTTLKKVISQEISQAGSLVAFDRLRFDFNFHRAVHDDELQEIEELINQWIGDSTLLQTKVMPVADEKEAGAIAMFGEKYGEKVRVVEVPGVSMELCGGTHVSNTSEICVFKIISEKGIASGIRRIEAVAGEAFIEYINSRDSHMKNLCSILKVKAEEVKTRVANLMEEL
ncbi:hypothetical protein SLEP1_g43112 [Rubroshorea leprosula]|uniref:alanine--tRNA ligase n=1 Tax=Rubroshorea leprosula TaxID=152421 RepID=A0AAV5LDH2_9ROSI|nr:hypothetical protein SLEP1_g43112 [Rubroshorea leprosula]